MAQIEIKDLTFKYSKADAPSLININLEVEKGEFVVICGKSGCGKTTLLRNLKTVLRPFGVCEGNVLIDDKKIDNISEKEQAQKIGFVLQDPEHQIVTDKVWHELAFGLENLGYKQEEIRLRVSEMSEYFDITTWYYSDVDKLSGGQKQQLNLAAVMAMHPDIMILDEPTAQLDPIAAENFLNTLKKINEDLGTTIILSEHRLNQALPMADKVFVLENGMITASGSPKSVIEEVEDRELFKLMPIPTQIFAGVTGKSKDAPITIGQGRKWIDEREIKNSPNKENIQDKRLSKKAEKKEKAMLLKDVWFRYEKHADDIVKSLDLSIDKGEIFCIMGGNGTGKTTTLSLITKVNKYYRGSIKINGKISALPQNVQCLFSKETVEEELESSANCDDELEKLLKEHPYDLSGGQQQKLALAKVLKKDSDILILDEPTKGIDGIYKEKLGKKLLELKRKGKTILMVSHDIEFCAAYGDRCGLFAQGSVVAVDKTKDFFSANQFYTTAAHKMTRHRINNVVTKEDAICYLV